MRRSGIKVMALVMTGGFMLQLGGCWQWIGASVLNAFMNTIVTQFLPYGVKVVQ